LKNFLAYVRATLTRKKGWWEHTFSFYRIISLLQILEENLNTIENQNQKYKNMKNTIRNLLFRSGKISYALALKSGENKNYKLEKFFYSLSKFSFETRFFLYGF